MFRSSLAVFERVHGPVHEDVGVGLNNLAMCIQAQGSLDEAEALLRRSLDVKEDVHGADHPETATALNNLGLLLERTGRLPEAADALARAFTILEASLEPDHPNLAACVASRARVDGLLPDGAQECYTLCHGS